MMRLSHGLVSAPVLLASLALTGCAMLDPAPYDPRILSSAAAESKAPSTLGDFSTLDTTRRSLETLAAGYAGNRNSVAAQQMAFDLPMIGLGVAALANPIFHGATAATVALGLGSAGVAGVKLYFSPQIRAAAYAKASESLFCAARVAATLDFIASFKPDDGVIGAPNPMLSADALATALAAAIAAANAASSGTSPQASLAVALATANSALADLQTARTTLAYAPSGLRNFAAVTISGATVKIVSGTQDIAAVLAQLKATQLTTTPTPSASPAGGSSTAHTSETAVQPDPLAVLVRQTALAQAMTKTINDGWSALSSCTAVY